MHYVIMSTSIYVSQIRASVMLSVLSCYKTILIIFRETASDTFFYYYFSVRRKQITLLTFCIYSTYLFYSEQTDIIHVYKNR